MAVRAFTIPAGATRALTEFTAYNGPRAAVVEQLTPADWSAVKTTLETIGAVYVPTRSAWDFEPDQDARALVAAAVAAGKVMAAANAAGYVPTPADLAVDLVAELGEVNPEGRGRLRVLEPSAGTGVFVRAILRDGEPDAVLRDDPPVWLSVDAVECDPRRAAHLTAYAHPSVTVYAETFEAFAERARTLGLTWDRIIANPPFATPDDKELWMTHLAIMWELLAPGGRLVAIVPASIGYRQNRRAGALRELIAKHGGRRALDTDAFAASGTGVQTCVVWLDRPNVASVVPTSAPPAARRWAWRQYPDGVAALAVPRLILTPAAAESTPVQIAPGLCGLEVWRYVADCHGCRLPVWDGGGDIRNHFPNQGGCSLDPFDCEGVRDDAPPVALCGACGNTADKYDAAVTDARAFWSVYWSAPAEPAYRAPAPVEPVTVVGAVEEVSASGWGQLELFV